jgi:hypothetical protein
MTTATISVNSASATLASFIASVFRVAPVAASTSTASSNWADGARGM